MRYVWAYAGAALLFFTADMIWLGFVARGFYRAQLGAVLVERPLLVPAAIFYVAYVAAIVFFAIAPALREQSWQLALLHGALFGAIAYATYDLSNLATLRDWPPVLTVVDLTWGTAVTALAALTGYWASSLFQAS